MVWRRVLVPASISLRQLHGVVQVAMGWDGIHLFEFCIRAVRYGSFELHGACADVLLKSFGFRQGAKFRYVYDLGAWWDHEIRLEGFQDAMPGKSYPVCIGGSGVCPPEDCGGPDGYKQHRDDARFCRKVSWVVSIQARSWDIFLQRAAGGNPSWSLISKVRIIPKP